MSAPVIPPTAPFTEAQRAWLNGFFAGLFGSEQGASVVAVASRIGSFEDQESNLGKVAEATPADEEPWHDPTIDLEERLKLAEGKPAAKRLMSAMAQLDCGACGYLCRTYGEAIASGTESNLSLCVPGGAATSRAIKKIVRTRDDAPAAILSVQPQHSVAPGSHRPAFINASLRCSEKLNGRGSSKDTRHVVIEFPEHSLQYDVGDALGVQPVNSPETVIQVLKKLRVTDHGQAIDTDVAKHLRDNCCLRTVSDRLLQTLADRSVRHQKVLMDFLSDGVPDGFDVFDVLERIDDVVLSTQELLSLLEPLKPRLYSIASSQKSHKTEVVLTVGKVTYEQHGRKRHGVCSTMLAEHLVPGDTVRVFVHKNQTGFTIPNDDNAPLIMIGPGTGIAPFMAFLEERECRRAEGKNWLFFGDQFAEHDFLYQDRLRSWQDMGLLTRLSLAFSRDQPQKIYVQDRMREFGESFWQWLQKGAYLFVCGDAKRMAKDVDLALHQIIAKHGQLTDTEAAAFLKRMRIEKRYVQDVY